MHRVLPEHHRLPRRESDLESFHSATDDTDTWPTDPELEEAKRYWLEAVLPDFPEAARDPLINPQTSEVDKLVLRFLTAERNQRSPDPVGTTVARLREMAEFRRAYRCADFHRKGMARRLFMHGTNPGSSMYFGDCGLRDAQGHPVLIGRVALMADVKAHGRKAADNLIPGPHLRAGIFVVERAASMAPGASVILDLSAYPDAEMAQFGHQRFWDEDGFEDCSACVKRRVAPSTAVGPHLPQHDSMPDGLPVLKEALRIMTQHYPESLRKVYFYKPNFLFRAIFKIFRMWVPEDTRNKFVMVSEGEERRAFLAPGVCDPKVVPKELGGDGPSLDGDRFLLKAVDLYDSTATLPELA